MLYNLRLFLFKMQLFYNSNVFGSCNIHILYTGCSKIKKIIPAPKGMQRNLTHVLEEVSILTSTSGILHPAN